MKTDYLERILTARVYDVAVETPLERAPAREGTEIFYGDNVIGTVTSGGFGPSVDHPVAMGYIDAAHAAPGTKIDLMVRGKPRPAEIADLPFVPSRYKR